MFFKDVKLCPRREKFEWSFGSQNPQKSPVSDTRAWQATHFLDGLRGFFFYIAGPACPVYRKGTIWQSGFGAINVIPLRYLFTSIFANEMTYYYREVYTYICQHAFSFKTLYALFQVFPTMYFTTTFKYVITKLYLICVTMCSYASTRAESGSYCVTVSIVYKCIDMCSVVIII